MVDQVFPCLLLPGRAEAAVRFHCDLLPGSRVTRVVHGGPKGPEAVLAIEFELMGKLHLALNAGPEAAPSFAASLVIACEDQAELDRCWDALADGGAPHVRGWVIDRFGTVWQVVPARIPDWLSDPDRGPRVFAKMVEMTKLDIAALEEA